LGASHRGSDYRPSNGFINASLVMVAAAPLAAVECQQQYNSQSSCEGNAHLQREGGAHGFHPHFRREHVLWPRRMRSIQRAQVLVSRLAARVRHGIKARCIYQRPKQHWTTPSTTIGSPLLLRRSQAHWRWSSCMSRRARGS
jgi:hypothetical protein